MWTPHYIVKYWGNLSRLSEANPVEPVAYTKTRYTIIMMIYRLI